MIRVLPVLRLLSTLSILSTPKLLPWIRVAKALIILILFAKHANMLRCQGAYEPCDNSRHVKLGKMDQEDQDLAVLIHGITTTVIRMIRIIRV